MKKIILFTFLIISTSVFSQQLDETYLNSLPDNVREDVLSKMNDQEKLVQPLYRYNSASSMVDKPILNNENNENNKSNENKDKILRFGEDFFNTMQSSFMPINEPNLDATYVLDFGDVLEIQLIGQQDSINEYPVKRDGSINIPGIGKLKLSGLSLSDASSLIKSKVNNSYIGMEAFISLSNIRDIRILISGDAFNPGIFTLNGNSNMLHALSMAGGIGPLGSYRNIQLIRGNNVIDTLDLYDVIVHGKSDFGKRLQSGDSILVSPVKKVIHISGVRRPGIYELKDEESFLDLINFANGFKSTSDINNMNLFSIDGSSIKKTSLDLNSIETYKPRDLDKLIIREFKFNVVSIKGAIKNPGEYRVSQGARLSYLINSAGGYEETAYPFGGYLNNVKSEIINREAKEKLYNKFLNSLIENGQSSENNNLQLILNQIKNTPSTGRVIAEFDLDMIQGNSDLDIYLEDGDSIIVPHMTQQVYIFGEVSNQGAIRYTPGQDYEYYINSGGGNLTTADLKNIFVIHPNGQTQNLNTKNSTLSFLSPNSNNAVLIFPGSIIYVPRESDLSDPREVASIWAPIISSLALSLTSLSVLSNN